MFEPAERGNIADAFVDGGRHDRGPIGDADDLTDRIAPADPAPDVRSSQRTLGHGRVGTRRGIAPLPIIRPRRNVD